MAQRISTKELTLIGLMTAVTCILGPLSITLPFSPVPISFTNLAICLTVFVLGMKNGTISYCVYLLLGIVGLPVFSGFSGGLVKVVGPTGGYLVGFIFIALISGWCVDHYADKLYIVILGMVVSTVICYAFGTVWLGKLLELSFGKALAIGVIPYLPGDAAKIVIAAIVGPKLRAAVRKI